MRVSGKPTIINGTLTLANAEYEIDLPLNCHSFEVKARTNVDLKLSFTVGESATSYLTIPAGTIYYQEGIRTNSSLYVQCATAASVVEVVAWSGGDDL